MENESTSLLPVHQGDRTSYAAALMGLAFWWPCVFQADFNTACFDQLNAAYALMRYVFPFALLVITIICALLAQRHLPKTAGAACVLLGFIGLAGYMLQMSSGLSSFRMNAPLLAPSNMAGEFFCAGAVLSAFYLIAYLVMWLEHTRFAKKSALPLAVTMSYLVCESFQMVIAIVPSEWQIVFRLFCPLVATLGLLVCHKTQRKARGSANAAAEDTEAKFIPISPQLRSLGLCLGLALLFTCFGDFFSHAISARLEEPGAGFERNMSIPLASLAVMALIFTVQKRCDVNRARYPLNIVLLLSVSFMTVLLFAILMTFEQAVAADHLLIAIGHCFKISMLITLAWGCVNHVLTTSYAACLHVTLAVSLPLLAQNYFEKALTSFVDIESAFVQVAGVGLFAIGIILIAVAVFPKKQGGDHSAQERLSWLCDRCREATAHAGLTPKEIDVVVLAYRGFTTKKVAESLGISTSTADTHLRHAYRKLSVHSRQELIDLIDSADES